MADSLKIMGQMFSINNVWIFYDGSLFTCGLEKNEFLLLVAMLIIMVFADFCKYNGIVIREKILKQDRWFRCVFVSFAILLIMTFGIYGPAYDNAAFVYFQF